MRYDIQFIFYYALFCSTLPFNNEWILFLKFYLQIIAQPGKADTLGCPCVFERELLHWLPGLNRQGQCLQMHVPAVLP